MVTTRRNAAAPASSTPAAAAMEQFTEPATPATEQRARQKRVGRKVAPPSAQVQVKTQRSVKATSLATPSKASATTAATTTTATTTTTTTTRRLRSKPTESPLKVLEETKRTVQKASAPKATPQKEPTLKSKRKRDAPHDAPASASATPEPEAAEPESAQDESSNDLGIFFTHSRALISSTPSQNTLIKSFSQDLFPTLSVTPPPATPTPLIYHPSPPPPTPEIVVLRRENFQLSARITELEQSNVDLIQQNGLLIEQIDQLIDQLQAGQAQANQQKSDIDSFGISADATAQPEFIRGDASAIALLHKIESAAREPRTALPDEDEEYESEPDVMSSPQRPQLQITEGKRSRDTVDATPERPASTPSASFLSRSYSAFKSTFGFSTSTLPAPSPAAPSPTRTLAPADSMTEALSAPPTPVGERRKTRPRKKKQSPMLRLLTKGVEHSDMAKAEDWAKNIIPVLKNDVAFEAKRARLETPVLVDDLNNYPSSKPWESGFGDPLAEMDLDDVAPVWAVYLDIVAEADQPQHKKHKTDHEFGMGVEDTPSMNELFPDHPKLHDSQGHSASIHDFHPRRSVEPSPMFSASASHHQGQNVFGESQGREATAQLQTKDKQNLLEATRKAVSNHNPSQGSFGLDYDSDDDDSSLISETSEMDASASPIWTQAPPPAPVPAHAPLPGGSSADAASSQQPVDEVERQRMKLMKHTPAKPSRLREAFVPSPSLMSDAGNESIFLASPLPATGLFDDMPDAAELDLSAEDWAAVDALSNTAEWKASAARTWPDALLTYESEEDELSPI
jgi:hypothetical protein